MDNNTTNSKHKKQHRKKRQTGSRSSVKRYPLLCFDTETTNHGELLELSVFDLAGNEIYHQYFRPRVKKWPTDIHHITPEMVADKKRFIAHRREVQQLLNSADCLLGCALSNDLHTLKRHGVELNSKQTIFDIQKWNWLLNDDSERNERHQAGLSAIAKHYGLDFGELKAHSATADTCLTLQCFKALVKDFGLRNSIDDALISTITSNHTEGKEINNVQKALADLLRLYEEAYQHAIHVFRMKNSAGFINVVKRDNGFSLKYTRFLPVNIDNVLFSVPVTDRIKAEEDLRKYFEPIQIKGLTGFFDFGDKDFQYIKNYTNTIDLQTFLSREKESVQKALKTRPDNLLPAKKNKTIKPTKQNSKTAKAKTKSHATQMAMRTLRNQIKKT